MDKEKEVMMRSYRAYQERRSNVSGKTIIGIDPGKSRHQAVIIDTTGIPVGKTFSFSVNHKGYHEKLWNEIKKQISDHSSSNLLFAVEASCNLWQTICNYLRLEGYEVVLVSPMITKQSRVMLNNDFSKTDPKDALLIGLNTQRGYYNKMRDYLEKANNMRSLSIAYDKLRKDYNSYRGRLRAAMELVFPELLNVITLGTKTSYYLLGKYLFPAEYLNMDIQSESIKIEKISRRRYGIKHLHKLQELAKHTIGISSHDNSYHRTIILIWLQGMKEIDSRLKTILDQLIELASSLKEFSILTNIMGISAKTASLFLAEIGAISAFNNYKEIEKYAGCNLRLTQSGKHVGSRRISHLGNTRLRWILYQMTEETMKYIPEVRIKYLKRQLKKQIYRKNLVACIPQLLKLIFSLLKENRYYEYYKDRVSEMEKLNEQYQIVKAERVGRHRKRQNKPTIKEELRKIA
ncbi:MAG: IS110 family transposase [Bacteroidota bacterium]|nr:IS110 family transposase [Bacteroidota bacterium]